MNVLAPEEVWLDWPANTANPLVLSFTHVLEGSTHLVMAHPMPMLIDTCSNSKRPDLKHAALTPTDNPPTHMS
jgi:hypothetical protein